MNFPLNQLDFNLLLDLDTLLREGSVIGAARSLHLSPPAMSRRLARLRDAIGDPLFVPAGRGLVPTNRALALREQVRGAIESVRGVFTTETLDLKSLQRTFTLRSNDGFAGSWATGLTAAIKKEAPGVSLHFVPRAERTIDALRRGIVDLDIGVLETENSEIRKERLFLAGFVGVVRHNHPLVGKGRSKKISAKDLTTWDHISTSQTEHGSGRLDQALRRLSLQRRIAIVAPGFQAALMMVACSDMIAVMPEPFARWASKHLRLQIFNLPVVIANVVVSQSWHVRQNADPVHRWFRRYVKEICSDSEVGTK